MVNNKNEVHKTVLLDEAVDALEIEEGDVIVDATLGAGGHTLKILEKVGEAGVVIAFDLDKQAIEKFIEKNHFKADCKDNICKVLSGRLILVNDNFKNVDTIIEKIYARGGISSDKVDGVLADLGWRIEQIQDERYGMSFQKEMLLDMRMSPETQKLTAKKIVNEWSEKELINIFRELGEECFAKKIARQIVSVRKNKKINTTVELVEIIETIKKDKNNKINPATKVFQALRITVNEEFSNLNIFLKQAIDVLENEGRLVIISFHSLEDRLVKKFFRAKARGCVCPKELPVCVCEHEKEVKIISSKGIVPSVEEIKNNSRARSARMRIAQRIIHD